MFTLNCRGRLLVARHALVMGIINITPDSFYAGSRINHADAALRQAEKMIAEGADIIDVGAQSTRPGAVLLSAEEELMRISEIIELLCDSFSDTVFSIDTFYSRVARVCVEAGASLINDVSGGSLDSEMLTVAGSLKVPFVCMHMRGTPQNMQQFAEYDNVTRTVLDHFIQRMEACRLAGIHDIIIDPGFGFSKNISQNFELLRNLSMLKMLGKPILVGLSRKSTVYKTLGVTASEALNGTTVLNTAALMNGANILRVHDVKEARECVRLHAALHG